MPNPAGNAGLVADCAALLASKSTLEGTRGSLNWSADIVIGDWDGVIIAGNRVLQLRVNNYEKLNGTIPAELGNLADLRELHLSFNQLTGAIPAELANLANLRGLYLNANHLTGEIPVELGNLANLEDLRLSNNNLTGEIPVELGNLANLGWLYLHNNQLTGEVPTELVKLSNLRVLNLNANQLTGAIPVGLGNLANLDALDLTHNQLTGAIPAELGNLANLKTLDLRNNQLTGAIPSELGNLAKLTRLDLNHNYLTGAIPQELANLANLRDLRLRFNDLTGDIPAELGNISNLGSLCLYGNGFRCIPGSLRERFGGSSIEGLPYCDATATATPTPTATSVASGDVMNRLAALERQVAELAGVKEQVSALSTRVTRLEGASAIAPPSPTPTATPSPTPTATPSPTPTSVAGTSGGDACITTLAGSASVTGSWTPACLSTNSPNNRTYYARFYTFTLSAASEATITLSSADASPYLFLREGEWTGGAVRRETGSATASAATIRMTLSAGSYTIEASTWEAETPGDFTLELEIR